MTFDVAAQSYGRFMGRYSEPLAPLFLRRVGVAPGQRALDVGCGPGALTAPLAAMLGAESVAAVDPSVSFVAALRSRVPGVDVRVGVAEELPFFDDAFDVTLAQLVLHFLTDPVAGLAEMRRVTRPNGSVAACVWDHAGGQGPLALFWRVARDLDPDVRGEADLPGTREGQLSELCAAAGLCEVEPFALTVEVGHATADEWWQPFTLGVGPAGAYVAGLTADAREALRRRCVEQLPPAPFPVQATAWGVLAKA